MFFALFAAAALADSPLVSIDLASAYGEVPAVQRARTGELDRRVVDFLLSDAPYDQKAAAIDAFGWAVTGQDHAGQFARVLAQRRAVAPGSLTIAELGTSEKFVLGFLIAKDHYETLAPLDGSETGLDGLTAQRLLGEVAADLPDDFAVQLVFAMVRAQDVMAVGRCDVWRVGDGLMSRFPADRRNLRRAAVRSAEDFWSPYQSACGEPQIVGGLGASAPTDPELDEVFAITRFRGQIVTATEGGVVFWGPTRAAQARSEPVCADLLVAEDSLWVGCRARLLRWDGALWTVELEGSDPFAVALGPDGALRVRSGATSWARDLQGRFYRTSGEAGDEVLWHGDTLWRIDDMSSITAGDRRFERHSVEYPGGDPRSLWEDAEGRLWAADFERGLFRYDDAAGSFAAMGPVTSRGIGAAVDPGRGRRWYLHETDGIWLVDASGPKRIGLGAVGRARVLWLDERGDPWIGTASGLLHLKPSNGVWTAEIFAVSGR